MLAHRMQRACAHAAPQCQQSVQRNNVKAASFQMLWRVCSYTCNGMISSPLYQIEDLLLFRTKNLSLLPTELCLVAVRIFDFPRQEFSFTLAYARFISFIIHFYPMNYLANIAETYFIGIFIRASPSKSVYLDITFMFTHFPSRLR